MLRVAKQILADSLEKTEYYIAPVSLFESIDIKQFTED